MNFIALKMLMGDRAKYIGIIIGLTFASLLITQQASVFVGLMTRTFGAITDLGQADVWVMDPKVQFVDDVKPMSDTRLFLVRGVEGVQWAVPLYKGLLKARLENGNFQTCIVFGIDDATLVGGPPRMFEGKLEDLRRSEAVIVDRNGARTKLARPPLEPGGASRPLEIGDSLELNDHRAVVVGLCGVSRTFQSQPTIYTTYSRATQFAPRERRLLSFILVKAKAGEDPEALCRRINEQTGLLAQTKTQFQWTTVKYVMKYTGIPINFGIAVLLGFLVGTAIAGQTFYNFTLENIKQFGALKAMGASNGTLLRMIVLQALLVGTIGYGIGVGLAASFGALTRNTELAFRLPWQILALSASAVTLICVVSALISIRRVVKLEPAIVFKG
ncbi:MAG: ABC transporter permease [Planctomycetota bacterium]